MCVRIYAYCLLRMSPGICYFSVSVPCVPAYRICSRIDVAGWHTHKGQSWELLQGIGWITVYSHLHSKTDKMAVRLVSLAVMISIVLFHVHLHRPSPPLDQTLPYLHKSGSFSVSCLYCLTVEHNSVAIGWSLDWFCWFFCGTADLLPWPFKSIAWDFFRDCDGRDTPHIYLSVFSFIFLSYLSLADLYRLIHLSLVRLCNVLLSPSRHAILFPLVSCHLAARWHL